MLVYGNGSANTVGGVLVDAVGAGAEQFSDGDGTVPTWSAEPSGIVVKAKSEFDDVAVFLADHVGISGNRLFLDQLAIWLSAAMS